MRSSKGQPVSTGKFITAIEALEARQLLSRSISGTVFNDANASGTLNSGESGLAKVRVYVDLKNTDSYKSGDPNAITDSHGNYTISNVPQGTDVLRQVVPSGYRQTLPSNDASLKVTVGSSNITKQNFGDTQKGRLSGFAYNDLNHDGKRESNEPFLSGVTVYLDKNGNKKQDSSETSTTTNSSGFWIIGDLSPGTYTARFNAKGNYASYLQTQPASNGGYKMTLAKGQVGDSLLFGIYKPSSVKLNSEKRQISANVDETTKTLTSTTTGTFNKTATVMLSDGNSNSSITSDISTSGITASGKLDAFQGEDLDNASSFIDVKFTLTSTTAYNAKYTITGNNFSFELKKVGGADIIGPNGPSNSLSDFNYSLNKSGSLAAGQYELTFSADSTSSNPFETSAYTLNFAI